MKFVLPPKQYFFLKKFSISLSLETLFHFSLLRNQSPLLFLTLSFSRITSLSQNSLSLSPGTMTHPDEEYRMMKAAKREQDMRIFVCDAHHGIPNKCPCGGRMVDEVAADKTFDTLPGKRFFTCDKFKVLPYQQIWETKSELFDFQIRSELDLGFMSYL